MTRMHLMALLAGAIVAPAAGVAQQASPQLGTIAFPTSGGRDAQQHFETGVLYLHSFEYERAAQAFRRAQQLDSGFAMAYWGEAMTYNHPIWNERNRQAALAALQRLAPAPEARLAKAPTPRERAYLAAVETLYADGPKAERDTAYALAMEELARAYPDDAEARAFHALALLGLSQGVRVVPTYMRAAAILEELFRDHPRHPGVLHYLIHSYDDPTHAPLGLRAARVYASVAPDAAHAQHMTTHIFLAMGMWDEVVSQNEIAAALTGWGPGHYTSWLLYGQLQQGRYDAAKAQLERAYQVVEQRGGRRGEAALVGMRAHYVVNTERWNDPALDWPLSTAGAAEVVDAFVRGLGAYRKGDRALLRRQLAATGEARSRLDGPRALSILETALRGLAQLADGDTTAGLRTLRGAAEQEDRLPVEFGPPDVVKPSHELLGEVLLALGRPAEAQVEFQRALALAPKRARSLLGLARAARLAGDDKAAAHASRTLEAIWHAADPPVQAELVARGGRR